MKKLVLLVLILTTSFAFSQNKEEKAKQKAAKLANNYVYDANKELANKEFIDAEANYRRAISKNGENATAKYNLGNAYYRENSLGEAFSRFKQAGDVALSKTQKHKAFHNMGNVFMKNKEFGKAVEAYKEALRNDPTDDQTRYNLALAKQKQKEQQDQNKDNKDQNKDQNQDQNKDQNQDKKEGDNEEKDKKDDKKDQDQNKEGENDDKKDGEKKPDENKDGEGDKKEDKKDKNKGGDQPKDQKGKPRPNQLSPQQVKNLLEAMNNEEKKVQKKLNAKKLKGKPTKREKDW
ncbi:tetratricopeptide repeat protein [Leptobacterium flavescens]|uniref:Tetratricopeptide repeat protein n=1 Tax=Leptobacterium flavescens TaxID=472055 RepID=A0A6P0URE0_9FLAO|nr:tetratricopeptide repeat protein [Leptobacterium flavescens]NER14339.1 tetratricopeptide repeat protein [Leptobacterium flavescens]